MIKIIFRSPPPPHNNIWFTPSPKKYSKNIRPNQKKNGTLRLLAKPSLKYTEPQPGNKMLTQDRLESAP